MLIDRRALLAGTAAAPVALATPVGAVRPDDAEILDLWREWCALEDRWFALQMESERIALFRPAEHVLPHVEGLGQRFYFPEQLDTLRVDLVKHGLSHHQLETLDSELKRLKSDLERLRAEVEAWEDSHGLSRIEAEQLKLDARKDEIIKAIAPLRAVSPSAYLCKFDMGMDECMNCLVHPDDAPVLFSLIADLTRLAPEITPTWFRRREWINEQRRKLTRPHVMEAAHA